MTVGYLPMTADLLHVGHVRMIRDCERLCDELWIGLLDDENYKETIISFNDRWEMLQYVIGWGTQVIKQDSINPLKNLIKLDCNIIFSGDGFTKEERRSAKENGVALCDIGYHGEQSTTKIKERVIKQNADEQNSKK